MEDNQTSEFRISTCDLNCIEKLLFQDINHQICFRQYHIYSLIFVKGLTVEPR